MKWILYELMNDKVSNESFSLDGKIQENFVLNRNWCDSFEFPNEFDTPEDAHYAFKELCIANHNKRYVKGYTNMEMVCLPSFSIGYYDIEEYTKSK